MRGLSSKQMSKLYWEGRRKGKTHTSSFKMTGYAKRLSKRAYNSKWKSGKFGKYSRFDFDGDGKINRYDCRPFNRKRQDENGKWGGLNLKGYKSKDEEIAEKYKKKMSSYKAIKTRAEKGDMWLAASAKEGSNFNENYIKSRQREQEIIAMGRAREFSEEINKIEDEKKWLQREREKLSKLKAGERDYQEQKAKILQTVNQLKRRKGKEEIL